MHANLFDRYQAGRSEGRSLIHTLDPRVKVVLVVAFILSNVLLPDGAWLAFGLSFGLVLFAAVLSGLGWGFPIKRSFVALPFALAAITALFSLPGRPVGEWQLGPWHLVVTGPGVLRFTSVVVRSWLSVQMAILLVATTQFPDLIHALRHLRMPAVMVAVISFMYRYLFVLTDETLRLLRAREARSAVRRRPPGGGGGGSLVWRAQVAGGLAGQLFLRSFERSERVYNAMLARGYTGQLLTLNPHQMHRKDWLALGTVLAVLVLLQIVSRGF